MTAIIVQSLEQKIFFSNRILERFLFNKHACVARIVLMGHDGNCDVLAPGWPHSWPLP